MAPPMDEKRLRSLRLPELAALWLDCKGKTGTEAFEHPSVAHRLPPGTSREVLVSDLLAWQKVGCEAGDKDCKRTNESLRAPVPTPVRGGLRRKGRIDVQRCPECGWAPKQSVCTCPFLRMDPFHHVTRVLALAAVAPVSHWHTSYGSCSVVLSDAGQPCDDSNEERVELRMVRRRAVEQHAWPAKLTIVVNEKEVGTVESPNLDDFGHEVRSRPVPLDLSEHIPPGATCTLRLDASEGAVGDVGQYVFCVVKIGKTSVQSLLQEVVGSNHRREESESWQLLTSLLQAGSPPGEAEFNAGVECMAPWRQPLLCPLSLTRMTIPVRGRQCRHLRCFDLEAYLATSASTIYQRRWHCPLCGCRVLPEDIVTCDLTKRLLQEADPRLTEVPLTQDATLAAAKSGAASSKLPPSACRQGVPSGGAESQALIVLGPWRKRLKRSDGMVHELEH
mmetsp:Transcript_45451/g.83162  ORF Transcript_45451/g.83162 Transcript_45451/m.83162 type:complete len:448 (-) Transcript_45451:103-1446(-)